MSERRRREPWLPRDVVTSILAAAWFACMFFAAFPAGVLWLSGHDGSVAWGAGPAVGAGLIAVSQLVVAVAVVAFLREGRGTHAPFDPPREFVATGLYRRLRNPMYVAYTLTIAGLALLFESPALGVYTLAFAGLAHAYVVGHEEKELSRRFGRSYQAYCGRVPRWIPLVRVARACERTE